MTPAKLLALFLEQNNHYYYDDIDEKFYFYLSGTDLKVSVSSPETNGVKIELSYETHDKDGERVTEKTVYYVNDWREVKDSLDYLVAQIYANKNYQMIDKEGLDAHDEMMNLFKKVLSKESLPNHIEIKLMSNNKNIEVIKDGVSHELHLAQINQHSKNKIKTLTGCVEIQTKIITNVKNSMGLYHRILTMLVPGYDIHQYPILQKIVKNPLNNDLDDWLNQAKTIEGNIGKSITTIVLRENLEEKIESKKPKI